MTSRYYPRFGKRLTLSSTKTSKAKLKPVKDIFLAVQIMQPFVGWRCSLSRSLSIGFRYGEVISCLPQKQYRSEIPPVLFECYNSEGSTVYSNPWEKKKNILPRTGTEPRFLVDRRVFFPPSVVQSIVYPSS